MKDYADLHTHTIASGHAYGTITEMVHAGKLRGNAILQLQCDPAGLRGCPSFIRM